MKLLYCQQCGDIVLMRPEHRTCHCGLSGGHYLDDKSTVEQTAGTVSIALHNYDLRDAIAALRYDPTVWNPMMVFRAYINPHCETDVVYVPAAVVSDDTPVTST